MPRPFISYSIDALEQEYERASNSRDRGALKDLLYELSFRSTNRARQLLKTIETDMDAPRQRTGVGAQPRATGGAQAGPPRGGTRARGQSTGRAGNSGRKPTAEQQQAIDAFVQGGSLKINAYAGTGKTSTLQMLAHATGKRGQYIAFNKAIVADARDKFPNTVDCSTTHSLAFKATPTKYRSKTDKMTGKVNANKLAEYLNLTKNWRVDEQHVLRPVSQGSLILKTVQKFSQSADEEPSGIHVPRNGALLAASAETMRSVEEFAVRGARHVWSKMIDADDPLPLGHDGYLKLWALSEPSIPVDYILLDEAQDTNPVVLEVLRKQAAQMIYVGDKYQQIYEWRGAVNAMETIATDTTTRLTKSFRFGSTIAHAATQVLALLGETQRIVGNEQIKSKIGPTDPRTILARTNATTISALIEALDAGLRIHLVGGTAELMEMLRGVHDLKNNQPSTVADFFGFQNWAEVVEFARSGEGEHLLTFVNLVEARGERQLMWALNRVQADEEASQIIISTAHKAKGREWSKVRLMDDFLSSNPKKNESDKSKIDPAELRLFYVAMTRAREELEVSTSLLSMIGVAAIQEMPRADSKQRPAAARPDWRPPNDWKRDEPKGTAPASGAGAPSPKKRTFFQRLFGGR